MSAIHTLIGTLPNAATAIYIEKKTNLDTSSAIEDVSKKAVLIGWVMFKAVAW